jgi:hypothetical protein
MTAARVGWLACCVATGLLLQIAVQIKLLSWLPDFPVYDMLASFPAIIVVWAVPMCLWRANKAQCIVAGLFFALTITHFALTLLSSSSLYLYWRDVMYWPTLALGLATCWMTAPAAECHGKRSLLSVPSFVWTLGEAFTSPAAILVATSAGESTNSATYRFVIYAAWLTTFFTMAVWLVDWRMQRALALRPLAIASLAGSATLTCASLLPGSIWSAMLVLAGIRLLAVLFVARNTAAAAQQKAAGASPAAVRS